ncbi:MAG: DEAD/DEAH box helicase family protein [Phycisphaerales bacterium]|nr:DEAD/DEAH box helicase family protein [Phycisphaerales bacterium]
MKTGQNEAFSRVLIDKALEFSGWNLLDPHQVCFELSGKTGRADYVLLGQHGPLCVLEAKCEDEDPYDAKEQARGYAENLKAPFVILSNGHEHWFWNYTRNDQDAYRIERLPSPEDLTRLQLKNLQPPRRLMSEIVAADYLKKFRPDISVRQYQIKAMDIVSRQFDEQRLRKFLLEMATGTGKTLLCAALIRRFLMTRNAERVLFIVDRIELAKQTLEDFNIYLAEYKPVLYKTARRRPGELLGSSVVVATLQSLMVDRRYREEFTPFHFDLVVNDEAHRSIYGDAREVVLFFQATRIGLTATPKAYLKNVDIAQLQQENPKALEARQLRDTYNYFGCKPGFPTYRYDIIDAVKDPDGPFLCLPKIFDLRSDITTKALAESGWAVFINEQEENFKIKDLERKIFTPARNKVMCEAFLANAQSDPAGQIGRSLVFAVNQTHATELTKIFNQLQPGIATTITSRIDNASEIAKDFRDGKRSERIAVSVDMLSTGYNCRELLNIGLMRPIFSPTEYIQIKGRGTRLFTFKIGNTEYEKKYYFILDFCAVAEYFEEKYDYTVPPKLPREKSAAASTTYPPHSPQGVSLHEDDDVATEAGTAEGSPPPPKRDIPTWEGVDTLVSREITVVGPNGEKVDLMTFRGGYERDVREFVSHTPEMQVALEAEDDDAVETLVNERFYHRPEMYYSPDKLVLSYGVPASTPAFVYNAVGIKPLPTRDAIIADTVDSIAARFNLRYNEQKWLDATAQLIVEDGTTRKKFMAGDITIFSASQFNPLGGIAALAKFEARGEVFEALRQSSLIRQSLLASPAGI